MNFLLESYVTSTVSNTSGRVTPRAFNRKAYWVNIEKATSLECLVKRLAVNDINLAVLRPSE